MSCGIYKITNLINNKSYIGQSIRIENRFKDHCKKSSTSLISRAIQKYGKENFSFEILEICLPEQLDEREQYWIKYYDCCALDGIEKGYNQTRGGQFHRIDDYDIILNLWNEGATVSQIVEQLGRCRNMVARILQAQGISLQQIKTRGLGKRVEQYDTTGKLLSTYDSAQEILRKEANFSSTDLYNCLNHHKPSYQGFIFKYADDETNIEELVTAYKLSCHQKRRVRRIQQYDLNYNFIAEYASAREAARALGVHHQQISACCRKVAKTAYGYIWKYKE